MRTQNITSLPRAQKQTFGKVLIGKDESGRQKSIEATNAATLKLHALLDLDPAMAGKMDLMNPVSPDKPVLLLVENPKDNHLAKWKLLQEIYSAKIALINSLHAPKGNNALRTMISEDGLNQLEEQRDYSIRKLKTDPREFDSEESINFYLSAIARDEAKVEHNLKVKNLYEEYAPLAKKISVKSIFQKVTKMAKSLTR